MFLPTRLLREAEIVSIQPVRVMLPTSIKTPIRKNVVSQSSDFMPCTTEPLFANFFQRIEAMPNIIHSTPAIYEKPVSKNELAASRTISVTKSDRRHPGHDFFDADKLCFLPVASEYEIKYKKRHQGANLDRKEYARPTLVKEEVHKVHFGKTAQQHARRVANQRSCALKIARYGNRYHHLRWVYL